MSPPSLSPIQLPHDAIQVTDADEEVFFLYTRLSSAPPEGQDSSSFRGLGHLDSKSDTLTVDIHLVRPVVQSDPASKRKAGIAKKNAKPAKANQTQSFLIAQDKTALRSRKGDTGSVLWRASIDFAQFVLQELHFPSSPDACLFDSSTLAKTRVVELGAGTGLLGIALAPWVLAYTMTDIADLVPLIQKNVLLNYPLWPDHSSRPLRPSFQGATIASHGEGESATNLHVEELDWVHLFSIAPRSHARASYLPQQLSSVGISTNEAESKRENTLVLVVDCIYNPALLPPLVETLNAIVDSSESSGGPGGTASTTVLVVVELRAEDVVREFLELWLASGSGDSGAGEAWEVWSVPSPLGIRYSMWVGWRR